MHEILKLCKSCTKDNEIWKINQLIFADVDLDFSGLSAHQTKTLEMNIQVKLLELESKVEEERSKLARLRRQHYKTSVDGSVEQ